MYDDSNRGKISNIERYEQSKRMDYSNMIRRNNITPTDIDGTYDIKGKFFWISEAKFGDKDMENGQKWYFEHLMKMVKTANSVDPRYLGVVIVYSHDAPIDNEIIPRDQEVIKYYDSINLMWLTPTGKTTLIEITEVYESIYDQLVDSYNKKKADENAQRLRNRKCN